MLPLHATKFACARLSRADAQDADVKTERLAVEDYMVLQSTAPWLDCPSRLIVPHNGRTFELKVTIFTHVGACRLTTARYKSKLPSFCADKRMEVWH